MQLKTILTITLVLILIAPAIVDAKKGVGIVWDTETEIVAEDSVHCVQYGIYNPWDEDVNAILDVSDELKDVIANIDTEPKFISAETYHEEAIPVEFCFKVANIYEDDCLLGNVMCKQVCEQEETTYSGKILVKEEPQESSQETGSSTSFGVSVPLNLKVKCTETGRDWTFAYLLIIVAVLILIAILLYKRKEQA